VAFTPGGTLHSISSRGNACLLQYFWVPYAIGPLSVLSVYICCDVGVLCPNGVGWIRMPLGTEVGLDPGHIVLDRDSASPKGGIAPNFPPMPVVAKWLAGSRCHLVRR